MNNRIELTVESLKLRSQLAFKDEQIIQLREKLNKQMNPLEHRTAPEPVKKRWWQF